MSGFNINKLQRVQNLAARLALNDWRSPIQQIFVKLHWLPILARIKFKIWTLTYKLLSENQPANLWSLTTSYVPPRLLRSSDQGRHFNFFLGGQNFLFFNATGLLKNWKNSTLYVVIWRYSYIVPFFLSFFLLFLFFFLFSFFSFSWGGGVTAPPAPHKWRPCIWSMPTYSTVNSNMHWPTCVPCLRANRMELTTFVYSASPTHATFKRNLKTFYVAPS